MSNVNVTVPNDGKSYKLLDENANRRIILNKSRDIIYVGTIPRVDQNIDTPVPPGGQWTIADQGELYGMVLTSANGPVSVQITDTVVDFTQVISNEPQLDIQSKTFTTAQVQNDDDGVLPLVDLPSNKANGTCKCFFSVQGQTWPSNGTGTITLELRLYFPNVVAANGVSNFYVVVATVSFGLRSPTDTFNMTPVDTPVLKSSYYFAIANISSTSNMSANKTVTFTAVLSPQ